MISKHYSIMCHSCTKSEALFSDTLKDCREEAKQSGWVIFKGVWLCKECKNNLKKVFTGKV